VECKGIDQLQNIKSMCEKLDNAGTLSILKAESIQQIEI